MEAQSSVHCCNARARAWLTDSPTQTQQRQRGSKSLTRHTNRMRAAKVHMAYVHKPPSLPPSPPYNFQGGCEIALHTHIAAKKKSTSLPALHDASLTTSTSSQETSNTSTRRTIFLPLLNHQLHPPALHTQLLLFFKNLRHQTGLEEGQTRHHAQDKHGADHHPGRVPRVNTGVGHPWLEWGERERARSEEGRLRG